MPEIGEQEVIHRTERFVEPPPALEAVGQPLPDYSRLILISAEASGLEEISPLKRERVKEIFGRLRLGDILRIKDDGTVVQNAFGETQLDWGEKICSPREVDATRKLHEIYSQCDSARAVDPEPSRAEVAHQRLAGFLKSKGKDFTISSRRQLSGRPPPAYTQMYTQILAVLKSLPDKTLDNPYFKGLRLGTGRVGASRYSSFNKKGEVCMYQKAATLPMAEYLALFSHEFGHSFHDALEAGYFTEEVKEEMRQLHQVLRHQKAFFSVDFLNGSQAREGYQGDYKEFIAENTMHFMAKGPELRNFIRGQTGEAKKAWERVYEIYRDKFFDGNEYGKNTTSKDLSLSLSQLSRLSLPRSTIISIGRSEENDVVLEDSQISNNHAVVIKEGEKFLLVDLGSTNGTKAYGEKAISLPDVPDAKPLQSVHQVSFGTRVVSSGGLQVLMSLRPNQVMAIGRHPDNDLVYPERTVSRKHAKAIISEGHLLLVDLGSTNGTRINRQTLSGIRNLEQALDQDFLATH